MDITNDRISPKIAVIGGGTGSFTLLNSLKHFTPNLTALVNMADDGGSTGELRDELGVLPPGDVRQCLVALSRSEVLREVFNHRISKGDTLEGHTVGNLLISGLADMTGDFAKAVAIASEVLNISGQVVPVTLADCRLIATTTDGQVIMGEHKLDDANIASLKGVHITFDNPAKLNSMALEAIKRADMVVIAPGDLYTSIAPALAVQGMSEALEETKAKIVYVCNLVNKDRHTVGFTVEDYVSEFNRIVGTSILDYVVYNTETPSSKTLERYMAKGEFPVTFDQTSLSKQTYTAIGGKFISKGVIEREKHDRIKNRSLIRHDGTKTARALMSIYFS